MGSYACSALAARSWVSDTVAQEQKAKKKTPRQRKPRRRLLPKILLFLGYAVVIGALSVLVMMQKELRHFGLFGQESAAVRPTVKPAKPPATKPEPTARKEAAHQPSAASPPQERKATPPSPSDSEEITREEQQQLEEVLKAEGTD